VRAIELKVDHFLQDEFELRQIQRRNYTQDLYWKSKEKEIYDPVLSFQLSNDFHELRTQKLFIRDAESLEFAVLLEWNNIYYDDSPN
jgi:hypothetical protein